jgi:predicted NUDIX family phosphoesterase
MRRDARAGGGRRRQPQRFLADHQASVDERGSKMQVEDKYDGEQVLVVNSELVNNKVSAGLEPFQGIKLDKVHRYLREILRPDRARFYPRFLAEEDPGLKQIIPYCVFVHKRSVFCYVRGGGAGETRLVGNRSIGIGGHVNPEDDVRTGLLEDHRSTLDNAVVRERKEEIVFPHPYRHKPVEYGIINDDSNAVGRHHLGVVYAHHLYSPCVRSREEQIEQSGFVPLSVLAAGTELGDQLETWSRIVVDSLAEER